MAKSITPQSKDFSAWYHDLVLEAKLADYSPVKGCMVIRPNGYAIWESIQRELNERIGKEGVKNAYFPLFIPEQFLTKEAEHVEGFAPEVALVTTAGGKELEERLVVRPTSETIINSLFSKWIQSYRDLPLKINQWANVVRWEARTRLFLRTTEFLWQEGHTCHRLAEEANDQTRTMIYLYQRFLKDWLAIPSFLGIKSESEKFAGAKQTYCLEAMMRDGKALQAATSHDLSNHFAKAFHTKYLDEDGTEKYVYQSSWGVTTRLIGALVMTHSDDRGLILPPKVAFEHVRILPIFGKMEASRKEALLASCKQIKEALEKDVNWKPLHVSIDCDEQKSLGWKRAQSELLGIPFRIEIGEREWSENQVSLIRRDGLVRETLSIDTIARRLDEALPRFQSDLFEKAEAFRESQTTHLYEYDAKKLEDSIQNGFLQGFWCEEESCEARLKQNFKATIRALLIDKETNRVIREERAACSLCGKMREKAVKVIVARSY